MVRNTTGGTGTKSLARKFQNNNNNNNSIRLAQDEFERYGVVSKLLGNSMCTITFNDGSTLLGHIRNKFSGRNKRSNLISYLSFVLVGLRHFESPFKNCDILEVYNDNDVSFLSQLSSIHINHLLSIHFNYSSSSSNDLISFSNQHSITESIHHSITDSNQHSNHLSINDSITDFHDI
jgi:initiation factor 1A